MLSDSEGEIPDQRVEHPAQSQRPAGRDIPAQPFPSEQEVQGQRCAGGESRECDQDRAAGVVQRLEGYDLAQDAFGSQVCECAGAGGAAPSRWHYFGVYC